MSITEYNDEIEDPEDDDFVLSYKGYICPKDFTNVFTPMEFEEVRYKNFSEVIEVLSEKK